MRDGLLKKCTTSETLSALLWIARTKALSMLPDRQTKLLFAVDMRAKFDPPFPKGYFGNGMMLAHLIRRAGEIVEKPLSFTVGLI